MRLLACGDHAARKCYGLQPYREGCGHRIIIEMHGTTGRTTTQPIFRGVPYQAHLQRTPRV